MSRECLAEPITWVSKGAEAPTQVALEFSSQGFLTARGSAPHALASVSQRRKER